jgi:hypothetical protein
MLKLTPDTVEQLIEVSMMCHTELQQLVTASAIGKFVPMMRFMHMRLGEALIEMGVQVDTEMPQPRREIPNRPLLIFACVEMHQALRAVVDAASAKDLKKPEFIQARAALAKAETPR